MILYHYTACDRLPAIMAEGLRIGDVPLSAWKGENAVWLTTDTGADGHGLGEHRPLTEEERLAMFHWTGAMPPEGAEWSNKREIRITVRMKSDRRLRKWSTWSRNKVDPAFRQKMIETGGGKKKADSWFIYFGAIAPDQFHAVDHLHA